MPLLSDDIEDLPKKDATGDLIQPRTTGTVQPEKPWDHKPKVANPYSLDDVIAELLESKPDDWNGRLYFEAIQRLVATFINKNADYAGTAQPDALANFRRSMALGVPTVLGIMVRCSDKWSRIETLLGEGREGRVTDESLTDTMLDMANYLIIATMAIKDVQGGDRG